MFTDEQKNRIVEAICEAIGASNRSLKDVCADIELDLSTFYRWIDANKDFEAKYLRARRLQAAYIVDEIIGIADDSTHDTIITDKGEFENREWVNRSRLRFEARKWLAEKYAPKMFGAKIEVENKGSIDLNHSIVKWGDTEIKI